MLKTALVTDPINKNLEQGGQEIEVEDQSKKEPTQKSRKGQKTAKSKKWIPVKKAKASKAKNLGQSGMFLTADIKRTFIKLRQAFVKAPILNHFDSKRHIQIETNTLGYVIGEILNQLTLDDLG